MLCSNSDNEETKREFYDSLQPVLDKMSRRDINILMRDTNAKVGSTGKKSRGSGSNEKKLRIRRFCAFDDLL